MSSLLSSFLALLDPQALFLILMLLLAARSFTKTVGSDDNPIEFWHFYATKVNGKDWGDPNKLGVMVGIFASTLMVGYMFWAANEYNWYLVAIFFIWLTFIAGVEYFSKLARAVAAKLADKKLGTDTQESK